MRYFIQGILIIMAGLLPWQGLISVLLPEAFRFWKEGGLVLLGLVALYLIVTQTNKLGWLRKVITDPLVLLSILFLAWGLALVLLNSDRITALLAFRYLGFGIAAFLCVYLLKILQPDWFQRQFVSRFMLIFVCSCVGSVVFGVWAQFGGGFEVLQSWYSATISSWVPGQATPLYHQTSAGEIRMQGGASGPVAFGHLMVLALWGTVMCWQPKLWLYRRLNLLVVFLFLSGIYWSGSRAAMLGALIIMFCFLLQVCKHLIVRLGNQRSLGVKISQLWRTSKFLWLLVLIVLAIAGASNLSWSNFSARVSDSDHFTRPVEALKFWTTDPLTGHLGELGPAARQKNLVEANSDQAMIAENVWVDYLAQLGLIGFLLAVCIWATLVFRLDYTGKILIVTFMGLTQLATIFDMTPVALSFFVILALSLPVKDVASVGK